MEEARLVPCELRVTGELVEVLLDTREELLTDEERTEHVPKSDWQPALQ